ncbi:MBL fold metallo-hydrolase [Halosimplex rubrum]|uniref:MBL fold metallo-hydrolase n=1 Tax=Halosimplex rubrum TaxID=869889 RepID=A0A7D5SWT9_9EURY|nr:MBL fold metallo-hydrolase [Halosimplex rubrum]QLH76831.1 MBL fold metallo-hydrolase [Halosimplex rubrum]
MELEFIKSATVRVEEGETEVLCDPWLIDGAYYGSWGHYPPVDFDIEEYNDVDYIYVSHIHPDHVHNKTFERFNTDIPILIHDFQFDFLKNNLENMGFDVIELKHNHRTHLGGALHINILAADNCNPDACGSFFGCDWLDDSTDGYGSSQIDTMAVFDNGDTSLVNINDCPYELSQSAARDVIDQYEDIDHLLLPYTGAGPYPQCFENLSIDEKRQEAKVKKQNYYKQAENYINLFEPTYYTPFAGTYVLTGDLADLNEYRGVPTRSEAAEYLRKSSKVDSDEHECVLLNSQTTFNLETGIQTESFTPIDEDWLQKYISTELCDREFPYESTEQPTVDELKQYIPNAYERMEETRQQVGFKSDMDVIIELVGDHCARISMEGEGFEFVPQEIATQSEPYVKFSVDPRLLKQLLQGPRYAHWNNAEIGSHITYDRQPNRFERGLYYCMNFFHA